MSNVSYRIQGDKVVQIHEREQFSMDRAAFFKALENGYEFETPALPTNCRIYSRLPNGTQVYVVELKPNTFELTHTLFMDEDEDHYEENTTSVSMPWQYLVGTFSPVANPREGVNWQFNGLFLYWATERITSLDSRVIIGMVPNIYHENGKICLGDTSPDSTLEPNVRMEILASNFYSPSSVFNSELTLNLPFGYLEGWKEASDKDVLWWMHYSFGSGRSLKQWLGIQGVVRASSDPLTQAIQTGEAHW